VSKSVVVTGANSGIGLVTVLELAGAGYDVIGTVRSAAKAALVLEAAAAKDVTVRTVELDVNDAASTEAGFKQIDDLTDGRLWAVVNNAGYAQAGAVEDVSDEQARAQLETNLLAPMRIAKLVLPGMKERGDGRIVNVSSVAGRLSTPLMGWYCASKHALEAVTDALRMEVEPDGVRVILIEPGVVDTELLSHGTDARATASLERWYERVGARAPEDVAATIAYAVGAPPHVAVSELVVRARGQV
jgi:NADP-dependent 3-hydroxy acid dehydrogenase YdfG